MALNSAICLRNTPKVIGMDLIRDNDLIFDAQLQGAGIPVGLDVYPGVAHPL